MESLVSYGSDDDQEQDNIMVNINQFPFNYFRNIVNFMNFQNRIIFAITLEFHQYYLLTFLN